MIDPLVAIRLIFILGILNLVTGLAVFLTCRCLPGSKIGARLMRWQWYKRFFRYHCYVWYVFWPSVVVHAVLGITYFGWPF